MVSSIPTGARVLVTGATGYVGASVANQFMQSGYVVVGTARNAKKAESLKTFFDAKYGPGKFEIFETGDLEKEGVFDAAVKDVDAIAHVASPVVFNSQDPIRDVIQPAINGTVSLLTSAHKYGKNVKHVVITSSIASILDPRVKPDHIYTEKDWNDLPYQLALQAQAKGEPIPPFLGYGASKNEAERAVWKFKEEHKPSFALTTILPSFVYGTVIPTPQTIDAVKSASTAVQIINLFTGDTQDLTMKFQPVAYIDVGDVARAHVLAIEKADVADGQRYLLNAGPYDLQQAVDVLRKNFPERHHIIAKGEPGNYTKEANRYDASKATRELGIQYKKFDNVVLDTVNSVKHLYKL